MGAGVAVSWSTTLRRLHHFGYDSRIQISKPQQPFKEKRKRSLSSKLVGWTMEPGPLHWRIKILSFPPASGEIHSRDTMPNVLKIPSIWNGYGFHICHQCRKICFLKRLINTAVYQDVLGHFLFPFSEDRFVGNEFTFQHNLAPTQHSEIGKRMVQKKEDTYSWLTCK